MHQKYLIVDLNNMFHRAKHAGGRQLDTWSRIGMAIHITLASINKCWREQQADHVVFCLEGRSWRKDFYEPYKKNRKIAAAALTEEEVELAELMYGALDDFITLLRERSNCTVLQNGVLEADDLIAGWIQTHPNDQHVIVSTDTDFYQLLAENVSLFNGVTEELHTLSGIFDKKGKRVIDTKTKQPKEVPDPKWLLFEKCIRGDTSDNIFSAYPKITKKSTKNRVGLTEAYGDIDTKGFAWNNLMQQVWIDHDQVEHKVADDYERNRVLIDLSAQPEAIRRVIEETISEQSIAKNNTTVGLYFLKFCGKYDLKKIAEFSNDYVNWLKAHYVTKEKVNVE